MLTQINLTNMLVFKHLIWVTFSDDLSLVDDIGTITDTQCFTDIVISNQDTNIQIT